MVQYDTAQRAAALALKVYGASNEEIERQTGVKTRALNYIFKKAEQRGFDPAIGKVLRDVHVIDGTRSGRPLVRTDDTKGRVLAAVRRDRYGREKTCNQIAAEQGVGSMTIWRILRSAGYKKTKPTRKPGLAQEMKRQRLEFAIRHRDWTLEDWKNVIWSDETSVVLNHRRGGYRVWRTPDERFLKSCIRERWSGYQEFMFWGCFSYDKKGPCHIWRPETAKERKIADEDLQSLNKELEPVIKEQWELNTSMRRMSMRNLPGVKPQWKWDVNHGKLTRGKGKGVDWYRYQIFVLKPKLLPFAKECMETRPQTIVQEDKAPSHNAYQQGVVYSLAKIIRLLWPGNSPDLNMIEPCWMHLKRVTTKKGAPTSRVAAEKAWREAWVELEQWRIQAWIERIERHIREVIRLEGDNNYREGAEDQPRRRKTARQQVVL